MNVHKFWAYPSSYVILVLWGTAGFGYTPSFAAFMVHFLLTPVLMFGALWLAHHEGRKEAGESSRRVSAAPAQRDLR